MTDLSQTIAPKSDQLNADDLISGPRTIRVTKVARAAEPDQPIAVFFEGDGGKPFKPCKSMRRVLVSVWGSDGTAYAGRRMTIYRDDKVQFGGMAVGGIRISHVSDIAGPQTLALTVTRAKRSPYVVKPLPAEQQAGPSAKDRLYAAAREAANKGQAALSEFRASLAEKANRALDAISDELNRTAKEVPEHDADGVISGDERDAIDGDGLDYPNREPDEVF